MIYILYIERTVYRHGGYVKILFVYHLQEIKLFKLYFLKVIITENKVLVLSLLTSRSILLVLRLYQVGNTTCPKYIEVIYIIYKYGKIIEASPLYVCGAKNL